MTAVQRIVLRLSLVIGALVAGPPPGAGAPGAQALSVDGHVALSSFMALGDAHLTKLADVFRLLATTEEARSGEWERIRGPLADVAPMIVPAVLWFARPDGSYATVQQGPATASLADRAYFPRALGGETVLGDLVVSRSTSRNTAVVAVPVRGRDNAVVGVLGASIHLDSLGALIREEMGGLPENLFFFAIDSTPMGAIHSDPSLIFTEPMRLGDEGMRKAFTEILAHREGTVTYSFRGGPRTVLYRKSPVTGWWYAIGFVHG